MKFFLLHLFTIFCFGNITFADEPENFLITSNQASIIGQRLNDYENGKLDLQYFGEKAGIDVWRELIGYYLLHTNNISTKAKLPVARCYAQFHLIAQATELGEEYVNVYSNDWRGWRLLGYCYDITDSPDKAILAYSNSARLGPKLGYEQLAGCAMRNNRWDVVKNIVPQLLALKKAGEMPKEDRFSLITILIGYSLKTDREDIFIETLEGENVSEIAENDSIRQDITTGCGVFQGPEIDKIRKELELATRGSLGSTATNTLPP